MTAIRGPGQKPYFAYRFTCFALCAKVYRPACRTPQAWKRSITGARRSCARPRSQQSGRTLSGPNVATLPQRVPKFEPTTSPSRSATKAASGVASQRVRVQSESPANASGSGEADVGAEREAEDAVDGAQIVLAERADGDRHGRSGQACSTRRGAGATSFVLLLAVRVLAAAPRQAPVNEPAVIHPPGETWSLPATLVIPAATAPVPCIVFFAGSGPTDRDWLSPLLPGSNGSARQLADGLAARSIGSLRFDKVGSGKNQSPRPRPPSTSWPRVPSAARSSSWATARARCT